LQNERLAKRSLVFAFQACYIKQYHLSSVLPGFTCLVMLQSYYIVIYMKNKGRIMARPIRETPILFGEDARRFLARMQERHPESPEVRARRLRNYELMKMAYERGMAKMRAREEANGGIDPWFRRVETNPLK
jgi:hypothetical protein